MAFDETAAQTRHATTMSAHSDSVGATLVTTRHAERSTDTGSGCCTSRPPSMVRITRSSPTGGGPDSTRRFFLAVRVANASASYDGATTTSVNTGASASASDAGTGRLRAT